MNLMLPATTSITLLRKHIVYTRTRLYADARGKPHRELFDGLQEGWRGLMLQEVQLQDEQTSASAEIESEDFVLDSLVDEVDGLTARNEALRALLFKGKAPSVFKRPIAGVQLEAMSTWEGTLSRAEDANVKALAPIVAAQVSKSNAAVARRADAAQRLKEFYVSAARKKFIDEVNEARTEVWAYFLQLIAQHPELRLTQQYARSFFLSTQSDGVKTNEELSQVHERLGELRQEVAQFEALEKELIARKEAEAEEAAQEEAARAREEELERELAALRASRNKKKSRG